MLAIQQGDFLEHKHVLARLGVDAPEVRLPSELDGLDGLIIPGGESTTIVQLIDIYGFRSVLADRVREGLPVWGTYAGMIVLADSLTDRRPEPIHLMNIDVSRNAFGSQVYSFEADLDIEDVEGAALPGRLHQGAHSEHGRRRCAGLAEVLAKLPDGQAGRSAAGYTDGDRISIWSSQTMTRVHDLFRRVEKAQCRTTESASG